MVPADVNTQQFLTMIEQAARDPNVDVTKMERLFAMMKDMEAIRAERAFNEALSECQKEMPRLVRDGTNPETHSKYAKLDSAIGKITPIYTRHGFNISFLTEESKLAEHVKMVAVVAGHGYTRRYPVELPYDYLGAKGNPNKTKVHGVGSTFSYARRYLLYMIFNIALDGEDKDGNQGQQQKPQGPGKATEGNRTWFIEELGKMSLTQQAIDYAISKGIIMPDKGLTDWPLEKLPVGKAGFEKLFAEIKAHK